MKKKIRREAGKLGFSLVGFARAEPVPAETAEFYRRWLKKGFPAEMKWLERNPEKRLNPKSIFPDAQTIICLATNYYSRIPENSLLSRYVTRKDYHIVLKERTQKLLGRIKHLVKGADGFSCVDTSPILEKYWAEKAGLGWIGKNTLLITEKFGSWVFLSEILVNLRLEPDAYHTGSCGHCRKCLDACPNSALIGPRTLDCRRCVSYLTVERKVPADRKKKEFRVPSLFGCDLCQSACPWNAGTPVSQDADLTVDSNLHRKPLRFFSGLDEKQFRRRFAGTTVQRIGFEKFRENLAAYSSSTMAS